MGGSRFSFEILGWDYLCYNPFTAEKGQVVQRRQINFSAASCGYASPGQDYTSPV